MIFKFDNCHKVTLYLNIRNNEGIYKTSISLSDTDLKSSVVNWTFASLNERSIESTKVQLIDFDCSTDYLYFLT